MGLYWYWNKFTEVVLDIKSTRVSQGSLEAIKSKIALCFFDHLWIFSQVLFEKQQNSAPVNQMLGWLNPI